MRVTLAILAVTCLVAILGNPEILWLQADAQWWQFFTYALCHGNAIHLAVNMLALLSFGPTLERAWGSRKFLACYMICTLVGGGVQHLVSDGAVIGASGALFGLFAAYVIQNPKVKVISLIPYPIPAWIILVLYMVLSLLAYAMSWLPTIGHMAHVSGATAGLIFAVYLRGGAKR